MELTWLFIIMSATALSVTGMNTGRITHVEGDEAIIESLVREVDVLVATGEETEKFHEILQYLALPSELQRMDWNRITPRAFKICTVCKSLVKVIIDSRRAGMNEEVLKGLMTKLCVSLNMQTENVCRSLIDLNMPIIFYIVDNKPNITSDFVCGIVLQKSSCSVNDESLEWTIDVDDKPAAAISSVETTDNLKIVQISDLHYDPAYEVNGNADCSEPTCCRLGQNDTNTSGKLAGYWGDYNNCDSPWHALVDAFDQIKNNDQDATYIYFTGDVIDHGVWETTQAGNIESIAKSYAELYDKFGSIQIYPILGNHEPHPMNVYAPVEVTDNGLSTAWLFELSADIWIRYGWLPESTRSTILQGGFYTVSPKSGFRIIALNNNVCYSYNWWLLYNPQDPYGQLQWLADTLLQAEKDGEYVHILAHIPPGENSCQYTWGREYRRIINRFAHIITGQFNGHTHNDEFRVFYDLENTTQAINLAWNGGSISTYTKLNPNYRVYTVNANTYEVEEAETWIYNLTLANETPDENPVWFKSYSFKEEYGLNDLSPRSVNDLVHRMALDSTILSTYHTHFVNQADPQLEAGCDDSCLAIHLCEIVTAATSDTTQCEYFSNLN